MLVASLLTFALLIAAIAFEFSRRKKTQSVVKK
jgi:hypothetical protein